MPSKGQQQAGCRHATSAPVQDHWTLPRQSSAEPIAILRCTRPAQYKSLQRRYTERRQEQQPTAHLGVRPTVPSLGVHSRGAAGDRLGAHDCATEQAQRRPVGRALAVPTGCFIQMKHHILQKHLCTTGFTYLSWPNLHFPFRMPRTGERRCKPLSGGRVTIGRRGQAQPLALPAARPSGFRQWQRSLVSDLSLCVAVSAGAAAAEQRACEPPAGQKLRLI